MRAPPARRPAIALVAIAILAACGGERAEDPAPRPLADETAVEGGPAAAGSADTAPADARVDPAPGDPRMVLFDVKTALESVRPTQGGYPTPTEFDYEERWRIHRQRLDATFEGWDYQSRGESFSLRGYIGERAYTVTGP